MTLTRPPSLSDDLEDIGRDIPQATRGYAVLRQLIGLLPNPLAATTQPSFPADAVNPPSEDPLSSEATIGSTPGTTLMDGAIKSGQIGAGAVTGAKFAATIKPVLLVSGLPALPNAAYPVDTFVYDIAAVPKSLWKNVADVWTRIIGPADIQADSITAGQIASGAISTSELAIGARLTGEVANETGATPGVFIDSTGILIRSGKLTIQDEFGSTAMQASGFDGNWRDFIALGLYNARFQAGTAGAVGLGRTSALPFWTVANVTGTPVLTYVAGGTLRTTWSAINTSKGITSDKVPVVPLRQYEFGFGRTVTWVAGTIRITWRVYWYKGNGSPSATPSTTFTDNWTAVSSARTEYQPVTAPADAYLAAVEFISEELVTHNAGNQFDLFLVWLSPAATVTTNLLLAQINTGGIAATGLGSFGTDGNNPTEMWSGIKHAWAGGALTAEGVERWDDTTRGLVVGDSVRAKPVTPIGWQLIAYPNKFVASDAFSNSQALAVVAAGLGGAIQIPFVLAAPMQLSELQLINRDVASLRSCEYRLYYSQKNNTATGVFVTGTDGTFSFTPGAASLQTSFPSGVPLILPPGQYTLVIRNTSAAQTFGMGTSAAIPTLSVGKAGYRTHAGIAALGATLDMMTGWGGSARFAAVALAGRDYDGATAWS